MNPYDILVDVWEGNVNIDEPVLLAGGVGGIIIRLNDMNGGHHMDTNFQAQWLQSAGFIRTFYFVYNPWVSGQRNFEWLSANAPAERVGKRIMIDVEVVYPNYSPVEYARQLDYFLDLCMTVWIPVIYTGAWFLPLVSQWPNDVDYWWARYPYQWYPDNAEYRSWERINADALTQVWSPGTTPGRCTIWQISGDRIKPPGCDNRAIDLNLWPGTREALAIYFGSTIVPPPPPPLTDHAKTDILWREAALHGWNLHP